MNVDEVKQIKDACIYRITFPDGKKYVGQTKNIRERFRLYDRQVSGDLGDNCGEVVGRLREYGLEKVDIDILARVTTEDRSDLVLCLSIMEIKYIRSENSLYPNGYNKSIGGEVLGIPLDYLSTELSMDLGGKPLLVYDREGTFLKEYPSIKDCAYNLGVEPKIIRNMIDRRDTLLADTYMIRSKKGNVIPKEIIPFKPKMVQKVVYDIKKVEKTVTKVVGLRKDYQTLKYNIDGEYCGIYETSTDAALSIGRKSIKKGVVIKGYIFFKYDGGEILQKIDTKNFSCGCATSSNYKDIISAKRGENIEPLSLFTSKESDFPVGQYTLDGKFIAEFGSIREAASVNGIGYGVVYANVLGKTRKGKGYLWRRLEN